MSETAKTETKKSRTGLVVVGVILVVGAVIGIIYLFSKTDEDQAKTTTSTTSTSNSGLSGLLGGLNLSGLNLGVNI